jgi:predicted metalloprotease with PDZ domain
MAAFLSTTIFRSREVGRLVTNSLDGPGGTQEFEPCTFKVRMRKDHVLFLHAMSLLLLALGSVASFGQCTFLTSESRNLLSYSFEPLVAKDNMALGVTLDFKGGPRGEVKLELPSEWAGQQHMETSITELKALSAGATLADTKSASEKELRFPPNSIVRISYVLVKDWDGPLNSDTRFRADLSPDYFHIVGTTSLVHPELDDFRVVDVHFDWQKLPAKWSLATSFGTDDHCQSFHGMWHEAVNSLFVGGDYRIYHTTVSKNMLNFAIRGKWSFTDDEWVGQVRKIMEFERTFWHDNDFPYFLVTLTPFGQDHGSSGGTALTNAFMEHLSRLDPLTSGTLGGLAHETFHAWTPGKMGHPPGSDYPVSWFFEGFTVYYEDLMLFRAGLMTFPDYVEAINQQLRKYELSEGMEISLQEFIRRHSADHSVLNQLDYRRGAVLATWLDATIRGETNGRSSLDNLMFDLVAQDAAYKSHHNGQPMTLNNKRIFRAASRYIQRASRNELRKYVEQGGSIRVPETALGPCVQSRAEASPKFDLGFDPRSTKSQDRVVFGVEPGSEAYKAGLRDGQKLVGWSFSFGETSKEVRLTMVTDHGDQVLKYYPRGPEVSLQQFSLDRDKYSSNPGGCVSALQSPLPRP